MTISALVSQAGPIRKGERSVRVLELQRALVVIGHQLLPDTHFGSITELAVTTRQTLLGLEPDGIVGKITARELDRLLAAAPQAALDHLIYVDIMYGLGDASTSAGMDVLGAALRALSNRLIVAPTVSWSARAALIERIRARPLWSRNALCGNSMGANAIPMVTNALPNHRFDLIAGYDPTIFWTCPAFEGPNVHHGVLYHGINWLNPIGHARYTPAFDGQIDTVNTSTLHGSIDDDLRLHRDTIQRFHKVLALAA